jgi:hypothetical protein
MVVSIGLNIEDIIIVHVSRGRMTVQHFSNYKNSVENSGLKRIDKEI